MVPSCDTGPMLDWFRCYQTLQKERPTDCRAGPTTDLISAAADY